MKGNFGNNKSVYEKRLPRAERPGSFYHHIPPVSKELAEEFQNSGKKRENSETILATCQTSGSFLNCQICEKNTRKSAKRKQKRTFFSDSLRFFLFQFFYQKRNLESLSRARKRKKGKGKSSGKVKKDALI